MQVSARIERPSSARGVRLAAAAVCVAAVFGGGLRAVQAHTYLPWSHHWDEVVHDIPASEHMVRNKTTVPDAFYYPALVYVAQAAVLVPATLFGAYDPDNADDSILRIQAHANARANHPRLLEAMRWATSVLPGVVMALATGATAWVITRRWWSATFASMLAAISAVDLKFGPFVTPDALAGATVALATLAAVSLSRRPSWQNYLLAGGAVGLAAAAKYNAGLVAIAVIAGDWIAHGRPLAAPRKALGAGAATLTVFALINHAMVLQPRAFARGIAETGKIYRTGHSHHEGASLLFNATTLWWTFGLALVLIGAIAIHRSDRQLQLSALLIGSFAGTYLLILSSFPARFERNLLPLTPALALLAATGLAVIVERARSHGFRWQRGLGVTASLLALAVPLRSAMGAMRDMHADPWSETQAWLLDNAPDGASIAVEPRGPYLDPVRYDVHPTTDIVPGTSPPDVDFYVASRFSDEPDPPGCKRFEVKAVWEGETKRITITTPPPC